MIKHIFVSFLMLASFAVTMAGDEVLLFNGKDLAGWTADVPAADKDSSVSPSFVVRNGMLVSLGKPGGHLITDRTYSDYRLVVEYRFPKEGETAGYWFMLPNREPSMRCSPSRLKYR